MLQREPSASYVTRFDGQPAHTRARASAQSFRAELARMRANKRERATLLAHLAIAMVSLSLAVVICKIHLLCLRTRAQNRNQTKTESSIARSRVRRQWVRVWGLQSPGGFPGSVRVALSMGMYAAALSMCPDNRLAWVASYNTSTC